MINYIISDIGGVLVDFRWKEVMEELQFSKETIHRLETNMIANSLWTKFDQGLIEVEELIQTVKESTKGAEREIDQFFAHMEEFVEEYDYTYEWLRSLKEKGLHLYYLSNYPKPMFENHSKTRFTFLPLMEGGVVSYEEHLLKPDAAIYHRICEKYGLPPEECLFFDDRKENVEAAIQAGMHGIVFESYEDAIAKAQLLFEKEKKSNQHAVGTQ